MKLNPIGANKTELQLNNGDTVLFSYKTPVAAHIQGQGWYRTNKKWSVTTSKHISQWIPRGATVHTIEQSALDAMVA